jgi:hypothetical protein
VVLILFLFLGFPILTIGLGYLVPSHVTFEKRSKKSERMSQAFGDGVCVCVCVCLCVVGDILACQAE